MADRDLDDLRGRLAGRKKPAARNIPPWEPPKLADFLPRTVVLAFDPSLSNLAWVVMAAREDQVHVVEKGTIRPETHLAGYMGVWDKARQADCELKRLIGRQDSVRYIACEAPWIERIAGSRTESTLIAGALVCINSPAPRRFRAVSAQRASAVLAGNRRHDKHEIRDAVARYIPGAAGRTWNEDQRDAAAVGLTCLWDLAHEDVVK
jgi:Holliday junction resolvasome RuvABC endonuclease subunit